MLLFWLLFSCWNEMYSMCAIKEAIDWAHYVLISAQTTLSLPAGWVYSETGDNKLTISPPSLCLASLPFFFMCAFLHILLYFFFHFPPSSLNRSLSSDQWGLWWLFVREECLYPHTCDCGRYILFGKGITNKPTLCSPHYSTRTPLIKPPTNLPPPLWQTRKCAQETAVPHVRPPDPHQVHPGNGVMCDRRRVADTVWGVVTVIRITVNLNSEKIKIKHFSITSAVLNPISLVIILEKNLSLSTMIGPWCYRAIIRMK